MDEMTITSLFARDLVSSFFKKIIKKKTGANIKIDLKPFQLRIDESKVRAHIEFDAEMSKEDFAKLMNLVK